MMEWHWPQWYVAALIALQAAVIIKRLEFKLADLIAAVLVVPILIAGPIIALHVGGFW